MRARSLELTPEQLPGREEGRDANKSRIMRIAMVVS
jgi:hypothetical protein